MKRITILATFIFLCSLLKAQNCDPEDLSLEGLKHYEKAEVYRINLPKGTHEQYIEELEAILRTDSLWQCSIIYKQLGLACEFMYTNKRHTKKKEYLSKSILYYKKYHALEQNDREVVKKIAKLEAELEAIANTINDSIKIEMVFVEGMLNEDTTACLHSFYIGKYEVTQKQWQSVMNSNPSHYRGPNLPVEQITSDYQLFLNELNRITGSHYRVPTLIEWFYAARGGKNKENYAYSGGFAENKVAWFSSNSGNRTHAVGEKEPNSLGIYDMSGNVSEICLAEYYLYSWGYKTNEKRALGGDFNSKPFMIMDSQLEKNSNNAFSSFYDLKIVEEYNKIESDFKGYHVGNANNKNIGLRLVLDVDYNSMSAEEQLWDTWIKQKKDRLQNEEEKKLKRAKRRDFFWGVGHMRWGIKIDYNFNGYGQIGRDDVFVNKLFSHTMLGLNFRIPIGDYFYIEPQIKAGIESDWKTASEQKGFFNQLSTCFDNVQLIHLEIPLIVGGIYKTDNIAFRGYTAGQFCPIIQTKYNNIDINTKPYFALLFGFGFDLGNSITADLYYRKPITNETRLTTQGFTASIGFLF